MGVGNVAGSCGPAERKDTALLSVHGAWWEKNSCLLVVFPSAFFPGIRCVITSGLADVGSVLGYRFGSYPCSYFCTRQGSDSAHSQKKLQDETKYLFVKLWRKQSLAALPLPLSSITVFKPYK